MSNVSDLEAQSLKDARAPGGPRGLPWRPALEASAVYALATFLTDAFYMGDTSFYSLMVANVAAGKSYQLWEATGNYSLWEFGHLLWRPLGVAVFPLLRPLARLSVGPDLNPAAVYTMVALNWLAGLSSVLLMHSLLRRVCDSEWIVRLTTVAFVFTQAFLNYTQTGCSYVPGLALLLLGMYLLVRGAENGSPPWRAAVLAGLAFAGAVGLWVPYMWAVPAAIAAPLALYGWRRPQLWRLSIYAVVASVLLGGALFVGAAFGIGIRSPGGLREWVVASSHHLALNRGLPQVVFGLARSFISMGSDNVVFKRYLLGDPYSPVSLADLFRLSLWKLALFYLFLAAVVANSSRSPLGRRLLGLLALGGVPVLGFALAWQGTVMERYLPWFPFLFLAVGHSLASGKAFRAGKAITLIFMAGMAVTNFAAMWKPALDRRQEATAARVRELQPLVRPQSIVLVGKDELENFVRDFPLNPVNHHNDLRVYSFLPLGMPQLAAWREDVARRALAAWGAGGDVFVSRRVFAERPRAEWEWVEGADPRVRWSEVHEFFAQLETGRAVGGEDGFVVLPPTPKNEEFLRRFATADAAHDPRPKV
ncbi:MAG TPA: hypothetical protein VK421_05385 [Pyrinomonadaceae bacterium]|nr:hypothetical protein [Pyrinomonadaceae bacterium]